MKQLPFSTLLVLALLSTSATAGPLGFAGMSNTASLVPFDLGTGSPLLPSVDLFPEAVSPYDVTIHPWSEEVWVCGIDGDGVVVVDTATAAVLARIDLPDDADPDHFPVDTVFDRTGNTAYVSDRDEDQVVLIDVATHTPTGETVDFPGTSFGPGWMAVHPLEGDIYLTDWQDDQIYVIDPVSLDIDGTSYDGSSRFRDLKFSPDGSVLYVVNGVNNDEVLAIDPDTMGIIDSATTGDDPWALDVTPDGSQLFVANQDSGDFTVVDTSDMSSQTLSLISGADPRDIDIARDGSAVYVPSGGVSGQDRVFVIDPVTHAVVDSVLLGDDDTFASVLAVARQGAHAGWLFADGFEHGDTLEWSAMAP